MKKTIFKSYGLYSQEELERVRQCLLEEYDEELDDLDEMLVNNINDDLGVLIDELTFSGLAKEDCVVEGKLGLWNGSHTIKPFYSTLMDCLTKCLEDENEIYEEDGELKINAYHHDGCNQFTISFENGSKLNLLNKLYGV